MRHLLLVAAFIPVFAVQAQVTEQKPNGVDGITPQAIAGHVRAIAADSMLGRDTPSRGLEQTAQYVVKQFVGLGLGTWTQRYRPPIRMNAVRSRVTFTAPGKEAATDLTGAATLLTATEAAQPIRVGVVAVTGPHTAVSLAQVKAEGKAILYVVPAKADAAGQADAARWLASVDNNVIIVDRQGPGAGDFTAQVDAELRRLRNAGGAVINAESETRRRTGASWVMTVRPDAMATFAEVLAAAGLDLSQARAERTQAVRELPSAQVTLDLQFDRPVTDTATAANVIGILEGSDPILKDEYVVLSAHMDHFGVRPGQTDSILNGADDASGVAGLIELARAFSQPGMRPKRSLIFLATSGGARDLSGSRLFELWYRYDGLFGAGVLQRFGSAGPRQLQVPYLAANVTLDMIGRRGGDSVVVNGLSEVDLPMPPTWMAAAHPELRLGVDDGGTLFTPESDHFVFALGRVPTLYFHNGSHGDAGREDDSPEAFDAELAARIVRLIFFVGRDIADAEQPPQWNSEGRRHRLNSIEP